MEAVNFSHRTFCHIPERSPGNFWFHITRWSLAVSAKLWVLFCTHIYGNFLSEWCLMEELAQAANNPATGFGVLSTRLPSNRPQVEASWQSKWALNTWDFWKHQDCTNVKSLPDTELRGLIQRNSRWKYLFLQFIALLQSEIWYKERLYSCILGKAI